MKQFLPKLFFSFLFVFLSGFFITHQVHAAVSSTDPTATNNDCTDGKWCLDPDVTFVGKVAARSGDFLDWTLQNYNWVCVSKTTETGPCDNSNNPLEAFWFRIFSIVAVFFGLFILVTAFVLIVTRGQNLTFRKFIPRIFFVIIFCVFSFSILRVIYVSADAIEGFFLKNPAYDPAITDPKKVEYHPYISQQNLLYIGFDYASFEGLRRIGPSFDESAFITLLLTKLTAVTYYAMTGILIIRKIILWFFIIISPIFPILMLYYPVRNTAKIWVGEFFRWLLYAPLFAVLLAGLVALWRSGSPIPLGFISDTTVTYPTAVNILLGGPGQQVSYQSDTQSNSVNNKQTFALYAIALIMLWVVILLPFILLQIFLDYLSSVSLSDNWVAKQLVNTFNRPKGPDTPPIVPVAPGPIRSAGVARPIPFSSGAAVHPASEAKQVSRPVQADTELLRLTNLSVPSMRDIAQYEISRISNNVSKTSEVVSTKDTLSRIADPSRISNSMEREHFQKIQDKLVKESKSGNPVANSILSAASNVTHSSIKTQTQSISNVLTQIANPETVVSPAEREKVTQLKETLVKESQKGNQLATTILRTTDLANTTDESSKEQLKQIEEQIKQAQAKGDPLAVSITVAMDQESSQAVTNVVNQLINPQTVTNTVEREKMVQLKEQIQQQAATSQLAQTINTILTNVTTANTTNNTANTTNTVDASTVMKIQTEIAIAQTKGDPIALSLAKTIDEQKKLVKAPTSAAFPVQNRVQSVSIEDYEAVRQMWEENYQKLDVPQAVASNRKEWLQKDIEKISHTVDLLTSQDQTKVKEGMDNVSTILPFLMIGGFSHEEVVAYLKAKLAAAKAVTGRLTSAEQEQETLVETARHAEEKPKEMTMEVQDDEKPSSGSNGQNNV